MSFGDVNLREASISGPPHNPGGGGWPTIRYFNKETGPQGGSYVQKTGDAICTELGNVDYMRAYVQEYGNMFSCSVVDNDGCDDKEVAYITKMKATSNEDQLKQLERLQQMSKDTMKAELLSWVKKRISILKQLTSDEIRDEL